MLLALLASTTSLALPRLAFTAYELWSSGAGQRGLSVCDESVWAHASLVLTAAGAWAVIDSTILDAVGSVSATECSFSFTIAITAVWPVPINR